MRNTITAIATAMLMATATTANAEAPKLFTMKWSFGNTTSNTTGNRLSFGGVIGSTGTALAQSYNYRLHARYKTEAEKRKQQKQIMIATAGIVGVLVVLNETKDDGDDCREVRQHLFGHNGEFQGTRTVTVCD